MAKIRTTHPVLASLLPQLFFKKISHLQIQNLIVFCMEVAGTIAFVGIRRGMDIFGICVLGVVASVGGGMTRDIILGNVPGALIDPIYVVVALFTTLTVFYCKRTLPRGRLGIFYERAMLVMDSIGLGIFTVVGVTTGIRYGYLDNTFLLTFLGTLTGVGGGLLRDMMAGVPPYIFVKHIYACASVAGAISCIYIYREFHAEKPNEKWCTDFNLYFDGRRKKALFSQALSFCQQDQDPESLFILYILLRSLLHFLIVKLILYLNYPIF